MQGKEKVIICNGHEVDVDRRGIPIIFKNLLADDCTAVFDGPPDDQVEGENQDGPPDDQDEVNCDAVFDAHGFPLMEGMKTTLEEFHFHDKGRKTTIPVLADDEGMEDDASADDEKNEDAIDPIGRRRKAEIKKRRKGAGKGSKNKGAGNGKGKVSLFYISFSKMKQYTCIFL